MECCRICLASNSLTNIFEIEEAVQHITSIACVDINRDDGLPQYICLLCKHELDISINFKDKCETTFDMLKQKYNKEIAVKENIILNLLSGGGALDERLSKGARECIFNTVKRDVTLSNICESVTRKANLDILEQEDIISEGMEDTNESMSDMDDQMTDDTTENETEISDNLNGKNEDLFCPKCNFFFINDSAVFSHMKKFHEKSTEQCQICLIYFPTIDFLKDHLSKKHDVLDETPPDHQDLFKCRICDKDFVLQSELNTHLCLNLRTEDFQCQKCEQSFKLKEDLDRHIQLVHIRKGEATCDRCHKKFKNFGIYKDHIKQHKNEPQKCEAYRECAKDSVSMRQLNKNEKSYKCPECDAIFLQSANLTAHRRYHVGNKPHVCSICHMAFYKRNGLENHLLLHDDFITCTKDQTFVFDVEA